MTPAGWWVESFEPQAKLAKDKEMKVLYRTRFSQPHWPRVMRESVREDSREALSLPRAIGKRGTNLAPS